MNQFKSSQACLAWLLLVGVENPSALLRGYLMRAMSTLSFAGDKCTEHNRFSNIFIFKNSILLKVLFVIVEKVYSQRFPIVLYVELK